jgi:hypothetical protein
MVGMPQFLLLQQFGEYVYRAFGHVPYHVGSSLLLKSDWRDVDVRLILSDAEYAAQGLGDPGNTHSNKRWVAITLAWSTFGRTFTGLPVDFQIQQQSYANKQYDGPRSALFCVGEQQ